MFQKTSKTLFYMKIMVLKIPPGGVTLSGQWPNKIIRAVLSAIHMIAMARSFPCKGLGVYLKRDIPPGIHSRQTLNDTMQEMCCARV